MSDSKIEEVARALSAYGAPNTIFDVDFGPDYQEAKRQEARIAIAAMRIPTEAMSDAGQKASDAVSDHMTCYHCVTIAFNAMIDEALK